MFAAFPDCYLPPRPPPLDMSRHLGKNDSSELAKYFQKIEVLNWIKGNFGPSVVDFCKWRNKYLVFIYKNRIARVWNEAV
jgi:hypothetical protein